MPRQHLANLLVLTGMASVTAGVWAGLGMPAGLITAGIASAVIGLVGVDVDKDRGADGQPPA